MITFTQSDLLEADVEAVVNTVNTVGIMGKGIALKFKKRFPLNFEAYARACEAGEVRTGSMFVSENAELIGPRWIINFPTKTHWRVKTKIEWIEEGLEDLVRVIRDKDIRSVAIPALGCGNGGLEWQDVRPLIVSALEKLRGVEAFVHEPAAKHQDVVDQTGEVTLTPARALIAEIVRRYCVLGMDCSILEVQKLTWFIVRGAKRHQVPDPFGFKFEANAFGPHSHCLSDLLDSLDGSYLCSDKPFAQSSLTDLVLVQRSES